MGKYKKNWESRPYLRDWIQEVPDDSTKAYCKACKNKLYAHRHSVLKHTATKKHQDNYATMLLHSRRANETVSQEFQLEVHLEPQHTTECQSIAEKIDTNEMSTQKCLLEDEAIIEGDDLVYNESVDVFITHIKDDCEVEEHVTDVLLKNVNHYETVIESDVEYSVEDVSYSEITEVDEGEHSLEHKMQSAAQESRTISSHILDTTLGKAAANVAISIYRLENENWKLLNQSNTNNDGRCSQLVPVIDFHSGIYKLHFNVKPYFEALQVESFYPFIEIVVECTKGQHYHVPLLLNPFGYSTYRGT